jgi:hypothetical protein
MTIALGIMGHECMVIGADTQETWGSQKYEQGKIMSAWRGTPNPLGAICISGAGDAACIDVSAQQIVRKFQDFSGTMEEFESWMAEYLNTFYRKHVMPFVGRTEDVPEFQLIIAARHERKSCLWTTTRSLLRPIQPYAVVGISRGSSQSLIGQLYPIFPSLNVASLLAAYVVRQAKLSADGVGLQTEIRFIFQDGTGVVPERTIQKWEEIFSNYQSLQREIFSYLSGFQHLKIRLPGVVSPKEREWNDVVKDLEEIRNELSKFPVLPGLDEQSRRSVSEMPE